MQFFPGLNIDAPQAASAGNSGKLLSGSRTALDKAGKGLNFAAMLSETGKLSDVGLAPFNDALTPGIAKGFASTKDDRSQIKTRDLNFFENKLRGKGVDEDVLQNFMSGLFSGPELPTIGKIMGAARNQGRTGEALNDQEKIAFSSLMQRIGFNTEEIAQMEELSARGKGLNILKSVESKLKGTGQSGQPATLQDGKQNALAGDILHLTKEELGALSKIFNLSEKSSQAIMAQFGDNAELTMTGKDFSKLFTGAKAELSHEEGQMNKIRAMVPDAIKGMLSNARIAENQEATTSNRSSRKLERSEIIMRDGATLLKDEDEDEKSGNSAVRRKSILSELGAKADKNESDRSLAENLRETQSKPGSLSDRVAEAKSNAMADERDAHDSKDARNGGENRREFSDVLKQDNEKAAQRAENGASGREILSSKLENLTGANFAQASQPAQSAQSQPNGAAILNDTRAANYRESIFDQVEQGIVRNAANGSKQITMRLDPPDLGRLTLQLTVNNGEVKALIRTEQTDVTRVVTEQLAALKTSLEEQGFKVASLEVETRTENHANTQNWSGADQHNKEQELASQANFLRLARSRNQEGETLARNLQSIDQQAQIAEQGLHIVA